MTQNVQDCSDSKKTQMKFFITKVNPYTIVMFSFKTTIFLIYLLLTLFS